MYYKSVSFHKAEAVWLRDGMREMNRTVLFECTVSAGEHTEMHLAGHSCYQVYINGAFIFFGPARAGRGYYRVDKLPIGKYLTETENKVSVLVSGYHCSNYYLIDEQAFLCAEFVDGSSVFSPTGSDAWKAYIYDQRVRKVQRYSFQRIFTEVYDFTCWDPVSSSGKDETALAVLEPRNYIEREISLPALPEEEIVRFVSAGKAEYDAGMVCEPSHALKSDGVKYPGFLMNEMEVITEFEAARTILTYGGEVPQGKSVLLDRSFVEAEMKTDVSGFIKLKVKCIADTMLRVTFDEILRDGKVDHTRMSCRNVVLYRLKAGKQYTLITAEPYTYKYINIASVGGTAEIRYAGIIRLDFNESEIIRKPNSKADEQIRRIYDAAVQTFRQNTLDIYMDCPSRERAGWLCDSFFTSRVEYMLTGKSTVEHAFLANFMMEESYADLPNGMLPMCYPSDHPNGNFIPNWAMWYCIELGEYLERTGDREFIDEVKGRMYDLLAYFRGFENADGLLEKLEKWVFVEWSECNHLVQDINYPTNMLYCKFKRVLSELYGDEGLGREADALKKVIRAKSLLGDFFCDNSVYGEDGKAVLSGERTETCQYYAFFTGVATPEEDKTLWNILLNDFGPDRAESGKWKEIHPSNAFIGNYLRCDLLRMTGEKEKLDENIRGYFDYMALMTGTIWENITPYASCNHGFASHVLVWMDYLGYID
ncbi:MAG: hypothetical protein E7662_00140 [Ruminococcaceae bacterium]|nr:hypothetical protein [Oscillospiraceae bacterium]